MSFPPIQPMKTSLPMPDELPDFGEALPATRAFQLRDYQLDILEKVKAAWAWYSRVLIVAATGTGKTTLFAAECIENNASGGKTLVLAHRDKLVRQGAKRIAGETGLRVDIEMAGEYASPDAPVVFASIQTLQADHRLLGFEDGHFSLVVTDECFPAGTMVDGKPIEELSVGDRVQSWSHLDDQIQLRTITKTFRNPIRRLVEVIMEDGKSIVCTPEHPFWIPEIGQYVAAKSLTGHRVMLTITERGTQDSHRNRRGRPSRLIQAVAGHQERRLFKLVRVDCVNVYESKSGQRTDRVREQGYVYNIEVEGNNNYFANGILVHNCHHSLSDGWQKVLSYFHYGKQSLEPDWKPPPLDIPYEPKARILGVTATPDLASNRSLGEFYQHVVANYEILSAVNDGWLVKPVMKSIPLKVDLRGLRVGRTLNGQDFTDSQLSERLVPVIEALADQIHEHARDRKSIAFVPSIKCAQMLAEAVSRAGMNGIFVSGACKDIDQKTERFVLSGKGTVLCNAALYVEGADFPDVDCVVCARATKSRAFYVQQVGRATRPLPGIVDGLETPDERKSAIAASAKPDFLILDPLWISDRLDLCNAYDLFTNSPEVKKLMAAMDAPGKDLAELEKEAERDFIKSLEKEAKKHANKQARTIDPLAYAVSLGDASFASYVPETQYDALPPSGPEIEFLQKQGMDTSGIKSRGLAQKIITRILHREKMGLASVKQLTFLRNLGFDEDRISTMKKGQAGAIMGRQFAKWHKR